jgi:hypothetical protein
MATNYTKDGDMIEGYNYDGPITFNEYGWLASGSFPADCVADCSHSGQCADDVSYWRKQLNFTVPREMAIKYLREFGAWPLESDEYDRGLNDMPDDELAEKVLWLACNDIQEQGEWAGLVH